MAAIDIALAFEEEYGMSFEGNQDRARDYVNGWVASRKAARPNLLPTRSMKYELKDNSFEFKKEELVETAASLYGWLMETEEKCIIDILALNGGEVALARMRKCIDEALKRIEEEKKQKDTK